MKKLFLILSIAFLLVSCAGSRKISYTEDNNTDIVNPERGFYIPSGTRASHFVPLDPNVMRTYREKAQQPFKAIYKVKSSLIYRGYVLDSFRDTALSNEFLINLQKDFDAVRQAGLKMIIRFAYTNAAKTGDCKDEYKICPPYGDAAPKIVFNHITQLKPLLQKNADVIAVMQEGFIGIWGENYFTDYFGDASTNGIGKITDTGWSLRNELLKKLLDALPADRMIQVRTPQIKQKFVYGPSAAVTSEPLHLAEAFTKSDAARLGFHNDCFLSGPDDYGTYYDYGSSSQPRQAANEVLRKYIEADTRFTAVGGETCDDTFSPQNDCEPNGHAETQMRKMHYSFLNAAYNTDVDNDWDSAGCMSNIKNRLGYRFVLRHALIQKTIYHNKLFYVQLKLENVGYASPFNPRPIKLVLRNIDTKREYFVVLHTEGRFLFSGMNTISEKIKLNPDISTGHYELLLAMPDPDIHLSKRPEYSIQLANKNVWESATGYNDLHSTVFIK